MKSINKKLILPLFTISLVWLAIYFRDDSMFLMKHYWHYWILYTISTWVAYVAGMTIKLKYRLRGKTRIGKVAEWLFKYLLDMQCNWFISAFPFFDLPESITELVTDRVKRYKRDRLSYGFELDDSPKSAIRRYKLAVKICRQLEKLDPKHCEV